MGTSVEVVGLTRLQATMRKAAEDIKNMDRAAGDAGRLVATRGAGRAPRRTGRLAGSVRVLSVRDGGAEVGSGLVYAPVIHNGWPAHHISPQPFLDTALGESRDPVVDMYARDVDAALAKVRGA